MKMIAVSDGPHLGFQIAPMIDVVFVIMLFFMVMAGAMKMEGILPAKLPGIPVDGNVKSPDHEVRLGVGEDGTITLNGELFDTPASKNLPALTATLQRLKALADRNHDRVLISVISEPDARYERICHAINAVNKANIADITFGVESDGF